MDFDVLLNQFIAEYGMTILSTIATALMGYIGLAVKALYKKYITDKTKASVVSTCVKAAEQMYKDIHGDEKLAKCIEAVSGILSEKGISISELEIRMLIEAAVGEFNSVVSPTCKQDVEKSEVGE